MTDKKTHFFNILKFYWRAWNYRLFKEQLEIKSLLKYLKPGDIAIDIGAYKGAYTYWMSKAVGASGKVFAFEPQKYVYSDLVQVINNIKIKNIVIEQIGLSSINGRKTLCIPTQIKSCSPGATFEIKNNQKCQTLEVPVETLDSYCQKLSLGHVNFIKCDAEGHELEIFRGSVEILKKYKPTLLFECEERHLINHKVSDVFNFLQQLGYKGQFFYKNKLLPLGEFQIEYHQVATNSWYVNNFLFT